jgi:alpha 1,2-mannosyltransferase
MYARNQVSSRRQQWQDQLRNIPPYPTKNHGKGVIIVAGGSYIEPALVLAMRLRELDFQHAIQLWHLGPEEIPEESLGLIMTLRVETCDFLDYVTPEQLAPIPANVGLRRFQLKPLAIIHSSLQEVLLLDADNSPLRNPAYLFELDEYKQMGAIFWPDYWTTSSSNPIWNLVDEMPSLEWEQESGQLLIDKSRAWRALQLCVLLNSEFYMRLLNGDKDTFRFAWRATRTPYHMINVWPATLGIGLGTFGNQSHLCGHTMLQHDTTGAPLFVHHNQMKNLVLPIGLNFRYLQRRTGPCRAAPRAGFEHDGTIVPCFNFVSPHIPYVEDHLMPVERAHLEIFELKYAMARRKVLRQLGWSLSGRPSSTTSLAHLQRRSVPFFNSNHTNHTFITEGNLTEYATVCNSSMETVPPTNTSDRLCEHLPTRLLLINISFVTGLFSGGESGFTVRMETTNVAIPRANISLVVGFTYAFLASVPQHVGLIITRQKDGGAGSTSILETQDQSPAHSQQIIKLVADFKLIGNSSLYYQSPNKTRLGGKISMDAASFEMVPMGLRVGTAFDPTVLLFSLQSNSSNAADLALECRKRCAEDPIMSPNCKGYYMLVTSTSAKCKGLSHVGEPTPTLLSLQSQSWIKVPVAATMT